MRYSDDLLSWYIFDTLYKNGSIQETARELQLDKSFVSKKLAALESQFRRKLFDRSKRPFHPTPDAHNIHPFVAELLLNRKRIERYYLELQDESLILRVMMGNSFRPYGLKLIAPYFQRFPKLRINVVAPVDVQDFLEGKADIMTAMDFEVPKGCIVLPRRRAIFVPCASPEYIKKHGPIHTPKDLKNHRTFSNLFPNRYSFTSEHPLIKGEERVEFTSMVQMRFSSVDFVKQATLDGLGVALSIPITVCIDDLMDGRLVPILDGWHRPSSKNSIVCKPDDWRIKHIRLFATWFVKELKHYEKTCEDRLASRYGEAYVKELLGSGI